MSRTNPEQTLSSPVQVNVTFNGADGKWVFYDKETREQEVKDKLFFIYLTRMHSVDGFNEKENTGIYANQVSNLQKEELKVKMRGHGTVAEGLWADIKDEIKEKGGKYAQITYGMLVPEKKMARITLSGESVSAWFEFVQKQGGQKHVDESDYVCMCDTKNNEAKKRGSVNYNRPLFEAKDITKDKKGLLADAYTMTTEIEAYFDSNPQTELAAEFDEPASYEDVLNEVNAFGDVASLRRAWPAVIESATGLGRPEIEDLAAAAAARAKAMGEELVFGLDGSVNELEAVGEEDEDLPF